jgi:hypothetical protein
MTNPDEVREAVARIEAFLKHAEAVHADHGSLIFCAGKTLHPADLLALLSPLPDVVEGELRPCPFCGGPARKPILYNGTMETGCDGPHECPGTDVLVPIAAWNRRSPLPAPQYLGESAQSQPGYDSGATSPERGAGNDDIADLVTELTQSALYFDLNSPPTASRFRRAIEKIKELLASADLAVDMHRELCGWLDHRAQWGEGTTLALQKRARDAEAMVAIAKAERQ